MRGVKILNFFRFLSLSLLLLFSVRRIQKTRGPTCSISLRASKLHSTGPRGEEEEEEEGVERLNRRRHVVLVSLHSVAKLNSNPLSHESHRRQPSRTILVHAA